MKLTGARRRALAVLQDGDRQQRIVRVSNATTADTVYWQTAEWLIAKGYARVRGDVIYLTDAGRNYASEALA